MYVYVEPGEPRRCPTSYPGPTGDIATLTDAQWYTARGSHYTRHRQTVGIHAETHPTSTRSYQTVSQNFRLSFFIPLKINVLGGI